MTAIRTVCAVVAALVLSLGMAATAQAQCTGFPCYRVYVNTTDGGGFVDQFSTTPFSSSQQGSDTKGNQEQAYGTAQFGSVGSKTSVDVVACPTNCDIAPTGQAGADYIDIFDLKSQGYTDGQSFVFDLSLNGTFGLAADLNNGVIGAGGDAQVIAMATLQNGSNSVEGGLFGDVFFPPSSSLTLSIPVDPSVDPFLELDVSIFTATLVGPVAVLLGATGSGFADFSTTFEVTNIALLDPNGNFLHNIVLTDTAGFTLPGPGPGPGTAPEPATLLLVASALAALGALSRRTRAN